MLSSIYAELTVFLIASAPMMGLHNAISIAIHQYNMHLLKAFLLSVAGNIFPVVFILTLLKPVSKIFIKKPVFNKFFTKLSEYTGKEGDESEKYRMLGLMIFVAIPLPLTGIWNGCIVAFIFGIRFCYSFTAISLGVIIAGIIDVTLIKLGYFTALATALVLMISTAGGMYEIMIKKNSKHYDTIP